MKPASILIVDKEEVIRESLHLVLDEEGFQCVIAEDESMARQIISTTQIDLVLGDSHILASKSFLEFLKESNSRVRVIIMSTYVEVEVTQKALMRGAHDFVIKPINFKELIDKIKYQVSTLS